MRRSIVSASASDMRSTWAKESVLASRDNRKCWDISLHPMVLDTGYSDVQRRMQGLLSSDMMIFRGADASQHLQGLPRYPGVRDQGQEHFEGGAETTGADLRPAS